MTAISDREQLSYIAAQAADARVNVEIETEGMTLNIGPQHPATHGTLRIVAKLDGEQVIAADPIMGYMHRGYEKLAEVRTYPQVTTLINRIDWVGSFANEVPFILAAEKLMDVEAPPRAAWIRAEPPSSLPRPSLPPPKLRTGTTVDRPSGPSDGAAAATGGRWARSRCTVQPSSATLADDLLVAALEGPPSAQRARSRPATDLRMEDV